MGAAGARVVVAESYARIFFRNSIATGEVSVNGKNLDGGIEAVVFRLAACSSPCGGSWVTSLDVCGVNIEFVSSRGFRRAAVYHGFRRRERNALDGWCVCARAV